MPSVDDIPKYHELMLPVLQSVARLGGSASTREIRQTVVELVGADEHLVAITYENRDQSVFVDRVDWARSYCKMGGLLDSPKRSLFLLTEEGRAILRLPDEEARSKAYEVNRRVVAESAERSRNKQDKSAAAVPPDSGTVDAEDNERVEEDGETQWTTDLISRLHRLSPAAFEEFCMYLLKSYGLELERVGGSNDEGIDGIGTAPLSPVLSARVAVQAKRYDPSNSISRDAVALFQRDAQAKGAERAIFITLSRFTAAARRAAVQSTPTVDLIDGDRICELVVAEEIGIRMQPVVDPEWFDRFEQ